MRKFVLLAAAGVFTFAAAANAVPALKVSSISTLAELQTPLPFPYDADANANKAVDAALALAKQQHKRAFIDLGGNWCGDCRVLSGLMDLPEYQAFIAKHYVVVAVDVGRFNKNLQIPARWGMVQAFKDGGAPTILIVDPQTSKVVDAGHTGALEDARHMTPQSVMDWMAQWAN